MTVSSSRTRAGRGSAERRTWYSQSTSSSTIQVRFPITASGCPGRLRKSDDTSVVDISCS
ncbi:Uncharacterised protein [Mycobacteroides abscessus subsp. abscessus]|nr:Uncharacterised protein [Mycobacteroides abscessus subsp. abscessus]